MNFLKKLVANNVEASENVTEVAPQPVQEPEPIPAPVVIPTKTIKKELRPMDYEVIISLLMAISALMAVPVSMVLLMAP